MRVEVRPCTVWGRGDVWIDIHSGDQMESDLLWALATLARAHRCDRYPWLSELRSMSGPGEVLQLWFTADKSIELFTSVDATMVEVMVLADLMEARKSSADLLAEARVVGPHQDGTHVAARGVGGRRSKVRTNDFR